MSTWKSTCTYLHTNTPLFTTHALSLTHIFSLTSTHLTHRRKSPVAYSFWLWFIFCALMPFPAVCLCVPGESRHSCWSDLITSGSNWWFCPHALEPQDPTGVLAKARLSWTLSAPPRHPLNTNSTSENPNILCVLLKSMPLGLFFMIFEVEVLVTVYERQTRRGEKVMNLEDRFPCWCVQSASTLIKLFANGTRACFKNLSQ